MYATLGKGNTDLGQSFSKSFSSSSFSGEMSLVPGWELDVEGAEKKR